MFPRRALISCATSPCCRLRSLSASSSCLRPTAFASGSVCPASISRVRPSSLARSATFACLSAMSGSPGAIWIGVICSAPNAAA